MMWVMELMRCQERFMSCQKDILWCMWVFGRNGSEGNVKESEMEVKCERRGMLGNVGGK